MARPVEEQLRLLTDARPARRWSAVRELSSAARQGNLRAIGALRMTLNDADDSVRKAAQRALQVAEIENVGLGLRRSA